MKTLLVTALLTTAAIATPVIASPFSDVTTYTVEFTLECGPGTAIAQSVIKFDEQIALSGVSHAVNGRPSIAVMINPDSGDYTIVLASGKDACVLDYGKFVDE